MSLGLTALVWLVLVGGFGLRRLVQAHRRQGIQQEQQQARQERRLQEWTR